MKKLFSLLIVSISLCSCVSVKLTDLRPEHSNSKLLPALETQYDIYSIESVFSDGYYTSNASLIGVNTEDYSGVTFEHGTSILKKDSRVQDIITLFDREVKDNITNPYGETKGFILCKIPASEIKLCSKGWTVLSGLTLFIPNWFGMPFGKRKTVLDVEVEIYDLNQKLIGRYNAECEAKEWIAMYYGYSDLRKVSDADRITAINAFKCAMIDIKKQIENDYDRLIKELNNKK